MNDSGSHLQWFDTWKQTPAHAHLKARPVAYFCAEYALAPGLPTYAGGLGVLAGDVVREAADRDIPFVAVGLYYSEGYICPTKMVDGKMVEACEDVPPHAAGLELVRTPAGEPLHLRIPIQDRHVEMCAWRYRIGSVDVYLLDSNVPANSEADQGITKRLYVSDKETRLKQEIILGIGGFRLLTALGIHPLVYHLNEGHSALLGLELISHQMQERRIGFDEAKQFARRRLVLTNHTLVAAGNEIYSDDLVALLLSTYAEELKIPVNEIVKLGLVQESSVFSLTTFALRLSGVINAVSKLQAKKAKEIWHDHPMVAVTNGIHVPTWDRLQGTDLSAPGALWTAHQEQKAKLLAHLKEHAGRDWEPDTLLLGWARRMAGYKRPMATLEDAERFARIARHADRPVRIVFGGRAHPGDKEGRELAARLQELVEGKLKDVAVIMPTYNLETAPMLVGGCDVWLNTPVVGFEACGTSGMKAALNGVLPCSTKDGWMDEVDLLHVGWSLDDARLSDDFLDKLEREIAPLYYDRKGNGVPEHWEQMMRNARDMILNSFTATRMLRQYVEMLYF